MKIKPGFEMRDVCGEKVIFANGISNIDYTKFNVSNETGAFIFDLMTQGTEDEALIAEALTAEYDIDKDTATADVHNFCQQLKDAGIAE